RVRGSEGSVRSPVIFAYCSSGFDLFHVLIVNADDWGRSVAETDSALRCYQAGRITSVSAMVFMGDSMRAAKLAKDHQLDDVELHLNFSEEHAGRYASSAELLLFAWRKELVEPGLPVPCRSLARSSISSSGLFFRPDSVH